MHRHSTLSVSTDDAKSLMIRRTILEESFESIRDAVARKNVGGLPEELRYKLLATCRELELSDPEAKTYIREVFETIRTFTTFMIAETTKE